MSLQPMYKGIAFSPSALLASNIGAGDTVIPVDNIAAFPPAPNYATIGVDESAETVLYTAIAGNALSGCVRGVEGVAQMWTSETPIARNFTNADYEAMRQNIGNSVQIGAGNANDIQFEDGETFQTKYDNGDFNGTDGADAEVFEATTTLTTTWAGAEPPYTQTVSVAGMTAAMNPIVDVVLSDDTPTAIAQLEAWSMVNRITTDNGSITAFCFWEKPTVAVPIQLKAVI